MSIYEEFVKERIIITNVTTDVVTGNKLVKCFNKWYKNKYKTNEIIYGWDVLFGLRCELRIHNSYEWIGIKIVEEDI